MISNLDAVKLNFDVEAIWLMNLCLAVVMFSVALDLKLDHFKSIAKAPRPALVGIFSQFLLLPALTFLLILAIRPQASIAMGMMLVAACPGGNVSNFMTYLAKGNAALSVSLTAFATVIAIIMTPLNLKFWGSLYPPTAAILQSVSLDPIEVLKAIVLILAIPLVLGMICQYRNPGLASVWAKKLKPFSIILFVGLIAFALAGNWNIFKQVIHLVIFIVFLHNALAMLSGFTLAKIFKLNYQDQKSLAIETGIQNSGLGLLLIFTFFNGLGGMAIVAAWWGIWHIVSGLSIATYWSYKASPEPA